MTHYAHDKCEQWYLLEKTQLIFDGNRHFRRNRRNVLNLMARLGIDVKRTPFVPVEHHLAHASSAYHLSGFEEKTAILGIDGKGEYATTFFGYGENGVIHKIKEFYDPDSLGGVYGALTQYLGFEMLQRSVWLGPSPVPQEFIDSLRKLQILQYMKFFEAKEADII